MTVAIARRRPVFGPRAARIGLYAFLAVSAIFFLLPLLLVIMNSLKPMEEIRQGNLLALPVNPNFDAWVSAWQSACTGLECAGVRPGLWNSIKITIPSVVISTLAGALNGYALAQWKSRHANMIMLLVTVGLFIPYQAMLYPTVKILSNVGLFRTYPGIVFVHVIYGLPYTTLLFRNFYVGIPDEISRAARMEGARFLRTFWSIILPISTNILVVVAILQFTGIWNDYLLGLIFAGNDNLPMTVQLTNIVGNSRGAANPNVNMAAALITAIPTLVVYFLSGRYFVRGIAAGAVKG
ncbi:carbohydrate ABC transporter permease [Mesorhizobium sp. RIZ17]|uniref:Carbohydrate ABC transporter permease n=1 Tax=Mesorhizobium humile TaxID=3072313 RepID=A0ABU4YQG5_9HYPH|nr:MULTISPECIES: carbohydrate ABC transporter permease [unclassified Mesorhizobium]MDX8463155.1 carbohydrate ABC transporter permease [Mesorhizobium sp. VK2D]MDX8488528.1 carbohydrate ABC transporter permease [Mesorhizobium sp. VK2B]